MGAILIQTTTPFIPLPSHTGFLASEKKSSCHMLLSEPRNGNVSVVPSIWNMLLLLLLNQWIAVMSKLEISEESQNFLADGQDSMSFLLNHFGLMC